MHQIKDKLLEELETTKKEAKAFQNSYEIIMETINDRDKEIKRLNEQKEKTCQSTQEKNKKIMEFEVEVKQLNDGIDKATTERELIINDLRSRLDKVESEKSELSLKIENTTVRYTNIYSKCETAFSMNESLTRQLDEVKENNKILEIKKIHHHQSSQRPKMDLNANFHISITFGSLVIRFLKL